MIPALIWLALLVLFLVVEAATVGLVSLWFAVGALGALIAALLGGGVWLQTAVFLVLSVAALAAMRPLLRRYVEPRRVATNADRILDAEGVVIQTIDNRAAVGQIRVGGAVWTARSDSDTPIEKDATVRVLRIEGVKAIVAPARQPAAVQ